ncbi:hypothetical protein HPB51_023864 [Rhipicephalus microplus]|uniref:Hexosyltransferase n=1 Tax=Rhipicephalus microplus TaxID=6941 RepID=A0A9J6FAB6_RHIMP|nr:hypothetical protein HPB51_023864 [Rhipicephalus microplus]
MRTFAWVALVYFLAGRRFGVLVPHISTCLKHLYSTHEDVEVGRCVRRHVGIPCTWSYEMQTIFYHNFFGEVALKGRVRRRESVSHSVSAIHFFCLEKVLVHADRDKIQYCVLFLFTLSLSLCAFTFLKFEYLPAQQLILMNVSVVSSVKTLSEMPSVTKYFPGEIQDLLTWDFFAKSLYSDQVTNPRRRIESYYEISINNVISDLMELTNRYSKQRGRVIEFKDVLYGYLRVDPLHGADYVLDLLLTYRKAAIRFVLPLCGRRAAFERFLRIFRDVCLDADEACSLLVVQYRDTAAEADDLEGTVTAEKVLGADYDKSRVEFLPGGNGGEFSRAAALELGASRFKDDELLFFIDVDMTFDAGVLRRVRTHTARRRSAYFPIVFSQYDPAFTGVSPQDPPRVAPEEGYWRQFGFGIAAIYKSDLAAVGGLDVSIRGWGKEDVDLFDRVVASNLTVVRAPDPGLVHVFHPVRCSPDLASAQFDMCLGTKWNSVASERTLAAIIAQRHHELLTRNFRR